MNSTGNNFKSNELNLRQYIINKITNKNKGSKGVDSKYPSSLSKDYNSHSKSSSMIHIN